MQEPPGCRRPAVLRSGDLLFPCCVVLLCVRVSYSMFLAGSCNPNCDVQAWNIAGYTRLGIYAKKDLVKGESLSYDYKASAVKSSPPLLVAFIVIVLSYVHHAAVFEWSGKTWR